MSKTRKRVHEEEQDKDSLNVADSVEVIKKQIQRKETYKDIPQVTWLSIDEERRLEEPIDWKSAVDKVRKTSEAPEPETPVPEPAKKKDEVSKTRKKKTASARPKTKTVPFRDITLPKELVTHEITSLSLSITPSEPSTQYITLNAPLSHSVPSRLHQPNGIKQEHLHEYSISPYSPSTFLSSQSTSLHSPSTSLHSPSTSLHSQSTSLHSPSTSLHSPSTSLHSPSTFLSSQSTSLHSPSTFLSSPSSSLPSSSVSLHSLSSSLHSPSAATTLLPPHMVRPQIMSSLQPADKDPYARYEHRGTNTLQPGEYGSVMYTRLREIEAGRPSHLSMEEQHELADPFAIVHRELELGLLNATIQTDSRLPTPVQHYSLHDLLVPDTLFDYPHQTIDSALTNFNFF